MARFTSIGIKKKTYVPSEGPPPSPPPVVPVELPNPHPAATPAVASSSKPKAPASTPKPAVSAPTIPADLSAPKARKPRRGTRGKKDKRVKPAKAVPAVYTSASTSTEAEGSTSAVAASEEAGEELVGRQDGERGENGRLTMAGLKGPKPGETATEHAARMQKKQEQKDRRTKDADARVIASEQRRLARMTERERETTCFACRQKGHSARDCPNALEGDLDVNGVRTMTGKDTVSICYRCGSTSHSLKQCRAPTNKADPMPFASCFVCLQKGHLAGKCPKNGAKGVYPEGGECKICRGKDHLAKDCSLRRDEQIAMALLPRATEEELLEGKPIGADEDDFHVLKRKRHEVELEEAAEAQAASGPKRKAPRPVAELKKPVVAKRKVVAF